MAEAIDTKVNKISTEEASKGTAAEAPQKGPQINTKRCSLLTIGMAGSGKTTFVKALVSDLLFSKGKPAYILNLDPAVTFLPYTPNNDIRQTIDYKKLMKEHQLGPNGAIMTALNLFCAQIDDALKDIDDSERTSEYVIVDTPGQIEVFTWSASGTIITQSLLATMPTVLLYVMDLSRCQNPNSFMSNMMFCCSIFYKMKLPMVIVLNKADAADKDKVMGWIKNYEALLEELQNYDTYLSTLSKSMVLSLDEFYNQLRVVAVSSLTNTGFKELHEAIQSARQEFMDVQYKDLTKNYNKRMEEEKSKQDKEIKKFMKDYTQDASKTSDKDGKSTKTAAKTTSTTKKSTSTTAAESKTVVQGNQAEASEDKTQKTKEEPTKTQPTEEKAQETQASKIEEVKKEEVVQVSQKVEEKKVSEETASKQEAIVVPQGATQELKEDGEKAQSPITETKSN